MDPSFSYLAIPSKNKDAPQDSQLALTIRDLKVDKQGNMLLSSPCLNIQEIDQEIDDLIIQLEKLRFDAKHELTRLKKFPDVTQVDVHQPPSRPKKRATRKDLQGNDPKPSQKH
ncbi:MAG: hypothetical protein AAGA18_12560 [Verrucomicrobiota bacterium]